MKWFKILNDYEFLRKESLSLLRYILFQVELLVMKALSLGLVKGKVVSSFAVNEWLSLIASSGCNITMREDGLRLSSLIIRPAKISELILKKITTTAAMTCRVDGVIKLFTSSRRRSFRT